MRGGLEPSWNGDLAQATLNPQPVFPELYYPLWWYSGNVASTTSVAGFFLQKGSTTTISTQQSSMQLYTHSSVWSASQEFAFEASIYTSNSSATATLKLWDVTSLSSVNGSSISTTSTTTTVLRSGSFTLTPGHVYAVALYTSNASYTTYVTDASLIIFPQAPLTSPSVSSISLANPSGNTLKEAYIPLWITSSGSASSTSTTTNPSLLIKGSTSWAGGPSAQSELYFLGSSWNSSQKFAFEASIWSNSSSYTASAYLYDCTSASVVSSSLVQTSSASATLLRSSSFTLTKGHWYGVDFGTGSGGTIYLTKAHLVALST